jgi:Mor family transcriptional regulator
MTDTAHLPTQYLPEGLRRIATYCGWDVMWAIWEEAAGTRIQVPKVAANDHWIVAKLGALKAQTFCEVFGGETLVINKGDAAKRAVRDMAIRAERAAGVDMKILCRRYNLTYRQIQSITREDPHGASRNFDLFD